MLRIVLIAGVGLFLFFLCGSLGLLGTWARLELPNLFPTVTATQDILFAADFSNPLSGWPTQEGYSYEQDGYHIRVDEVGAVLWAKPNGEDKDDNVSIYVDARPLTEGINGFYGLLCRMQDGQNFYYFVTRNYGSYTIGKYENADF